jgi:alcohol dehydrogenase class IV
MNARLTTAKEDPRVMPHSAQVTSLDGLATRSFAHVYPPTRVRFGRDCSLGLGPILERLGMASAMLVSGPNLAANRELIDAVRSGADRRIGAWYPELPAHAPISAVDEAAELYHSSGSDGLVSIGGGSSHDAARQIALCVATGLSPKAHFVRPDGSPDRTGDTLYRHFGDTALDVPPLVALPTTLSGAEATNGGAVTDPAERRKYVLMANALYFDEIVLDPLLFESTPRSILLSTGMNAVNHAVTRLISPAVQPIAEPQFVAALQLLVTALPRLVETDPTDGDALGGAILAAHMSESINVGSGISHALVHQLGARYDLGHGILNGIVLPGCVEWIAEALPERVRRAQDAVSAAIEAPDSGADLWLAAFLRELLGRLGLPGRLREVGVPRAELALIADDVLGDVSTPGSARPVRDRDEVIALLETCW